MRTSFVLAAVVAALGAVTPMVQANSVVLDTLSNANGTADTGWMVSRTTDPASSGTAIGVVAIPNSDIPGYGNSAQSGVWYPASSLGNGNSNWVSWSSPDVKNTGSNYAGDLQGTQYTYSKTFTLASDFTGPGSFTLSGTMAFDNFVSSVSLKVNDKEVPNAITLTPVTTYPVSIGTYTEFGYVYTINAAAAPMDFSSPTTFVLTVNGVNKDSYSQPGPTGFIFAGTATAVPVPLPAAAGVGFGMLGGFGLLAGLRKRLRRRARIA
jgi:hypothetical protein